MITNSIFLFSFRIIIPRGLPRDIKIFSDECLVGLPRGFLLLPNKNKYLWN